MSTREEATAVLSAVVKAIVETVNENPTGCPAGPMYAAFMSKGMSLETFQSITSMLVEMKMIAKRGNQFFPV